MLIFRTNVFLTLKFLYIRIQLLLFLVVYDVICTETRCTTNKKKGGGILITEYYYSNRKTKKEIKELFLIDWYQ